MILADTIAKTGWWVGEWKDTSQPTGDHRPLLEGDTVTIRDDGTWQSSAIKDGSVWISLFDGTLILRPKKNEVGNKA